jgi:hypothetical protein
MRRYMDISMNTYTSMIVDVVKEMDAEWGPTPMVEESWDAPNQPPGLTMWSNPSL